MPRIVTVGCAAVLVMVCVNGSTLAATRSSTDKRHGVDFVLRGHLLTATVKPQPIADAPDVRQDLQGRRVTAVCGTNLSEGKGVTTYRARRWPKNRLALKYWLPRDVSARVRWCVLETGRTGGDVAGVVFKRHNRAAARAREFQMPSKRIVCRYSSSGGPGPYLRCDVLSLNDTGFILDRRHRAKRIKVTDTAGDTTKAPILHYGNSRRFGPFRCRSRRTGLTCTSRTSGHGFALSRERQRVF
jgi:uncharacterized protein DUF6636